MLLGGEIERDLGGGLNEVDRIDSLDIVDCESTNTTPHFVHSVELGSVKKSY